MCNLSRFDWFPNQVVRTKDNLSEKVNAPNGIILNKIGLEAGSQGFPRKLPTDFSFNMPSCNVNPINQFDQGYYDQQKHLRIICRIQYWPTFNFDVWILLLYIFMFEIIVSLQCFSKTNLSLFGFSQFDREIFVLVVGDNVLFYGRYFLFS